MSPGEQQDRMEKSALAECLQQYWRGMGYTRDHARQMLKLLVPRCEALCRDGHLCRRRVVIGRGRCYQHGGLSTGPKTPEGRERIRESNRRRRGEKRPKRAKQKEETF